MVKWTRVPGEGRYEKTDASARGVLWAGVAMAATVAALGFVAYFGTQWLEPTRRGSPPITGVMQPPDRAPLNVAPEDTLEDVRRRHAERLQGYAWIDRDAGIARIPIDAAMRLLAERGWHEPAPERPPQVQPVVPARRVPLKDRATEPEETAR